MKDIYNKSEQELTIPSEKIKEAYQSYWMFIKDNIQNLDIKSNDKEIRHSFNLPSLGKLFIKNKTR